MKDVVGNFHDFQLGLVCESVDTGAESGNNAGEPADDNDDVTADCQTIPTGRQPHGN